MTPAVSGRIAHREGMSNLNEQFEQALQDRAARDEANRHPSAAEVRAGIVDEATAVLAGIFAELDDLEANAIPPADDDLMSADDIMNAIQGDSQ